MTGRCHWKTPVQVVQTLPKNAAGYEQKELTQIFITVSALPI